MSSLPTESKKRRTYLVRVWRDGADGQWHFFVQESRTNRKWLFDNHSALVALLTDMSWQNNSGEPPQETDHQRHN